MTDATTRAIDVTDLTVVRGDQTVLHGISLQVASGCVTGLLGPSGSGKTTLMRSIVGVQAIAGGSVTVLGAPAGAPSLRRRVAYVTQAPSVYSDLTVTENLRYFARILGVGRNRIAEVIASVGLTERAGRLAGNLSGGERTRASLAVALLGEPEVLVLDEPTVGIDPILRREFWRMFYRLAEAGACVLISSHVMDEAERCQQLLLMRAGEIIASGSPDELLQRTGSDKLEDTFIALAEAA